MRRRGTVAITRPVEEVYAYLADVSNEVHWRQSVVTSGYVDGGPLRKGTRGHTGVSMGSKRVSMGWSVVEHDPGRRVAWELTEGPWRGGGSYTVRAENGSTHVTAELEIRLSGLMRALEPVLGITVGRGLRDDLERLRRELQRA